MGSDSNQDKVSDQKAIEYPAEPTPEPPPCEEAPRVRITTKLSPLFLRGGFWVAAADRYQESDEKLSREDLKAFWEGIQKPGAGADREPGYDLTRQEIALGPEEQKKKTRKKKKQFFKPPSPPLPPPPSSFAFLDSTEDQEYLTEEYLGEMET